MGAFCNAKLRDTNKAFLKWKEIMQEDGEEGRRIWQNLGVSEPQPGNDHCNAIDDNGSQKREQCKVPDGNADQKLKHKQKQSQNHHDKEKEYTEKKIGINPMRCRQLRHVGRCISRKSSWPQDERKYVAEEKKKEKRA
ncbi:hypothetical protein ACLKA7_012089 [Drosophila subpalustris]